MPLMIVIVVLIHSGCLNGYEDIVRLLLDASLSKNATARRGEAPLHDASRAGHYAVVKILLETGADRKVEDESGRMPSKVMWENGNGRIMRLLDGINVIAQIDDGNFLPNPSLLPN